MTLPTPTGADSAATLTAGAHGSWFGAPPTEAQRKRRRGNRITATITGVLVVGFGGFRLVTGFQEDSGDPDSVWFFVISLAVLALIVWATLAGTTASARRRAAVALEARPGSEVFATARTPELHAALKASGQNDKGMSRIAIVSIGPSGVEVWGKRKLGAPVVTVPWTRVDHAEPAHLRVSAGRSSADARTVDLHIVTPQGRQVLPLPIYGPRALRYANMARANEVMAWFARYTLVVGTDI